MMAHVLLALPFALLRPPAMMARTGPPVVATMREFRLLPYLPLSQAPSSPSVARAVQRLAVLDALRAVDELCEVEGTCVQDRLSVGATKLAAWLESRELIIRWAVNKWTTHHFLPLLPDIAKAHIPRRTTTEPGLTLGRALAPIGPWTLARMALRTSPRKAIWICRQFLSMWASRLLLPAEVARQRRERKLAPTLMELAAAYDALR